MNIGTQILKIRKEKALTQEEFGKIFHVTRQTVSNWENERDSRSWKNKFVRFDQIVGKAIVRYYPSFKWLG